MNKQTSVKPMRLREKAGSERPSEKSGAEWIDCSRPSGRGVFALRADRLLRNLAVAGALLLVIVAVRSAGLPETQSVFSALQASMDMEWDESVGKLSFVNGLLPPSVREVWSGRETLTVYAPMTGETIHAWSRDEPYIELRGAVTDVRAAADGEIMSVAHGMEEERIVRLRHDDGMESIYGNLLVCYADVGDRVNAGEIFARVASGEALAFELRRDGRSVDPGGLLLPQPE